MKEDAGSLSKDHLPAPGSTDEQADQRVSTWMFDQQSTNSHSHFQPPGYPQQLLQQLWSLASGENSDPKNKGFLPGPGCSFGMGKVFLNVLASARVCLVKNKVCVH